MRACPPLLCIVCSSGVLHPTDAADRPEVAGRPTPKTSGVVTVDKEEEERETR